MLARVIHNNSPRSRGPFVELNCAAIPETLLESELFGAERGAHSTAPRRPSARSRAAEGGTLFLDEIGELTAAAQAKLLQLLATREYHPLGAAAPVKADVRIISATNANLEERVAARQFREDLYYRMHVVPVIVPGLEVRREDIPDLVEHFIAEACKRHKLVPLPVSPRALVACREAAWPGHTRQLAHAIEAAVIRAHGERALLAARAPHLPEGPARRRGRADARGSNSRVPAASSPASARASRLERLGDRARARCDALASLQPHQRPGVEAAGRRKQFQLTRSPMTRSVSMV